MPLSKTGFKNITITDSCHGKMLWHINLYEKNGKNAKDLFAKLRNGPGVSEKGKWLKNRMS